MGGCKGAKGQTLGGRGGDGMVCLERGGGWFRLSVWGNDSSVGKGGRWDVFSGGHVRGVLQVWEGAKEQTMARGVVRWQRDKR